jgi:hypothetical protein
MFDVTSNMRINNFLYDILLSYWLTMRRLSMLLCEHDLHKDIQHCNVGIMYIV